MIESIANRTTLLYSVDKGILLSLKELQKTRKFESLLRHQVIIFNRLESGYRNTATGIADSPANPVLAFRRKGHVYKSNSLRTRHQERTAALRPRNGQEIHSW